MFGGVQSTGNNSSGLFGGVQDDEPTPDGPVCEPHQPVLTTASTKVFINGKGAARVGDEYEGERITSGSPTVIIG